MRVYHSSSEVAVVSIRSGYYLTSRQCIAVSNRLAAVLDLNERQQTMIKRALNGDAIDRALLEYSLTPSEFQAFTGLEAWLYDDMRPTTRSRLERVYVVSNLNTGKNIVFRHE